MRVAEWDSRLFAVIEHHRRQKFEWGTYDCATLFRECVVACTGVDPLADLRPWYSASTALRALRLAGHKTAFDLVSSAFAACAPALARRGDVGFCAERDDLSGPAIIVGTEAVSRNESGLVVFPTGLLTFTFKV